MIPIDQLLNPEDYLITDSSETDEEQHEAEDDHFAAQ
jgi:hypothetical protein